MNIENTVSPSFTPNQTLDASIWDAATATPQRPWRDMIGSKVAPVVAAIMLASQGTTILPEKPSHTIQVVDAAQPNGQGFAMTEEADPTTMNDVTRKPDL